LEENLIFDKNIFKPLKIVLILFVFFMLTQSVVNAETDALYSIADSQVRAVLNSDGSISVHEFVTYALSSEFDGNIEKLINISRTSNISSVNISSVSRETPEQPIADAEMIPLTPVQTISEENSFTSVQKEIGDEHFKVLNLFITPITDSITIVYRYTLEDLVYIYNDTALLQWQFVPQIESVFAELVNFELIFPQELSESDIVAFAHGSPNVSQAQLGAASLSIQTTRLEKGQILEALVMFPKSLVGESDKLVNNNIYDEIIEFKESLDYEKRQIELLEEQRRNNLLIVASLLLFAGLATGLYFFRSTLKRVFNPLPHSKTTENMTNLGSIPEHDYSVAELAVLMNRSKISSKDLLATLMELVVKERLQIKLTEFEDKKTFMFELKKDLNKDELEPHEEYLINWMLNEVGTGDSFSLQDIHVSISNSDLKAKFFRKFETWTRIVQKHSLRWNFEHKQKGKPLKLTDYGLEQYSQWIAFKTFLQKIDMKKSTLQVNDWERYIYFAFTLGELKQLLPKLSGVFDDKTILEDNLTLLYRDNRKLFNIWLDAQWDDEK